MDEQVMTVVAAVVGEDRVGTTHTPAMFVVEKSDGTPPTEG